VAASGAGQPTPFAAKTALRGDGIAVPLIEDTAGLRPIAARHLLARHYTVTEMENADPALASLKKPSLDLLFRDVAMPDGVNDNDMDGWGFRPARRARPGYAGIKTVLTSADPQLPNISSAVTSARMVRMPRKPYRQQDLVPVP
jgi:DNA-binding NtrC family response regulator